MPSSIQRRNFQNMKAYRKQRQTVYRHCQLGHVTPSHAILLGVCVLVLPMLELASERAQVTTTYYTNHWHVHARHMTFSHTHLLPSLSNVLPAMVFQNRVAWPNIKCQSYASSHSSVRHVSHSPDHTVPSSLGRRIVGVVVIFLLLLSGDVEMNPGPVGEYAAC